MADALVCTHGFASPKSCVACMEEGPVEVPARFEKVGDPFAARYQTSCATCEHLIPIGHRIQRWDKGSETTRYTHEACRMAGAS